jgi:hypothetical protein
MHISKVSVSKVRTRKYPPSEDFCRRLFAAYPRVDEVPEQPKAPGVAQQNPHAVWLNRQTGDAVDDTREAEDSLASLDEVSRLILAPSYQSLRRPLLDLAGGTIPELRDVLLDPPEDGPSVALGRAQAALVARIEEARRRQAEIDPGVSSELYRRYAQFREQLRRKLERLQVDSDPKDLVKLGAWRATVRSLSALYQPHTELRLETVRLLRSGDALARELAEHLDRVRAITFPCLEFRDDPVGYVHTILGEDPWHVEGEDSQLTMLLSIRDYQITVVPSGRGLGKTTGVAWACHWWRDTRPQGRVCISNFTGNQLRAQDWAEIIRCVWRSGVCLECRQNGVTQRPCPHSQCIPMDELSETPTKGIWSEDKERFIIGITGADAQSLGGYHGEELLVICDEFSGTKQDMFDVWLRNAIGPNCRFLGPGNPLDGQGSPMHDIVTDERVRSLTGQGGAHIVHLDGEVAARAGKSYLPTAEANRLLEQKDPRGKENPEYQISVKGNYPARDELAVIPAGEILTASDPEIYKYRLPSARGRTIIGIDPSGETDAPHDLGVICIMRDFAVLEWRASFRWKIDDYLVEILDAWKTWRIAPNDFPLIGVDADGVGSRIMTRLQNYQESKRVPEHEKCRFELMPIYFGHEAINWQEYDLTGDEGRELLARWVHNGGVFPYNAQCVQEMQYLKWFFVRKLRHGNYYDNLRSATRKEGPNGFRKLIGRSPNYIDALTVGIMAAHQAELGIVPDARGALEVEDAESFPLAPPVNDRDAFRQYLRQVRKGHHG